MTDNGVYFLRKVQSTHLLLTCLRTITELPDHFQKLNLYLSDLLITYYVIDNMKLLQTSENLLTLFYIKKKSNLLIN